MKISTDDREIMGEEQMQRQRKCSSYVC